MQLRPTLRALLLATGGTVLLGALAPEGPGPFGGLGVTAAQAKEGQGGGGGDHGGGGGHGAGGGGRGGGAGDHGGGGGHGGGRGSGDAGDGAGGSGPGGHAGRGQAGPEATALDGDPGLGGGRGRGLGRPAAVLDPAQTAALIGRGWGAAPGTVAGGFRNHGQRVSTMVALAKALGYPASFGALQANFGTPAENGLGTLAADLGAARAAAALSPADPALAAEVERLEAALRQATASLPPGSDAGWSTADLDVNRDGVVDRADLDAALAAGGVTGRKGRGDAAGLVADEEHETEIGSGS